VPDREVRPPNVPASTYHAIQEPAYVDGGQVAAAAAEKALGRMVTVNNDGLDVVHAGDGITAVDGTTLSSTVKLSAGIQAAGGKAVTMTIVPTGAKGPRAAQARSMGVYSRRWAGKLWPMYWLSPYVRNGIRLVRPRTSLGRHGAV
jgi:hypothetical protein